MLYILVAILLFILFYTSFPSREGMTEESCTSLAYENQQRMDDLEKKFKEVAGVVERIDALEAQLKGQQKQLDASLDMKLS